jgi:F-type H+-transporting ATPase subunit alpha
VKIRTDEIASVIRQEIEQYASELEVSEVGRVVEVGDGIARVYGLSNALAGELLSFETSEGSVMGQVMNLELDTVGAVVYGDYLSVKEGDVVKSTGRLLEVPVGEAMLGRVIDPLGRPIDGKGTIQSDESQKVDIIAPGIADRQPVTEPLQTGIKAIDAMIPIGRGQRELIIGDRKTGKTAVAVDTIINQKQYWGTDEAVVCIYVAVGQKESTVAGVVETLRKNGAMDYTIVVNAASSDPAPMQYIAPYSGCSLGEHFMHSGKEAGKKMSDGKPYPKHALLVYDDLSKQAVAYRQLSLLLRRPPGREAYPGDVFYLHSRLLERATKLSDENGGGLADGSPDHRDAGGRRLGVHPDERDLDHRRADLPRAGPVLQGRASGDQRGHLGVPRGRQRAGEGDEEDRRLAATRPRGVPRAGGVRPARHRAGPGDAAPARPRSRMVELLKQPQYQPYDVVDQILSIYAGTKGFLDKVDLDKVLEYEAGMLEYFRTSAKATRDELEKTKALDDALVAKIEEGIKGFAAGWKG